MSETVESIPTDAELAAPVGPPEPYFVKDGKPVTGTPTPQNDNEPEAAAGNDNVEPEKAEAAEEERAPNAREIANAKRYRKQIAKRERELAREQERLASERSEIERLRTLRRENPRAVLDELGLTFRELAEDAARQEGEDPRDKALREVRTELEELKTFKKTLAEERMTQAQQVAFEADVTAVAGRIQDDIEAYPFLADYDPQRAAKAAVNAWYEQQKTGVEPDLFEILDSLENELRTDYERLHEARSKRVKPSSPAAQAKGAPERVNGAANGSKARGVQAGTPPPETLTTRAVTERASPDRPLSLDDRRRRAAGMLKFLSD